MNNVFNVPVTDEGPAWDVVVAGAPALLEVIKQGASTLSF